MYFFFSFYISILFVYFFNLTVTEIDRFLICIFFLFCFILVSIANWLVASVETIVWTDDDQKLTWHLRVVMEYISNVIHDYKKGSIIPPHSTPLLHPNKTQGKRWKAPSRGLTAVASQFQRQISFLNSSDKPLMVTN